MYPSTFIKGVVVGFSIAAPVGPIGILCISRTLASGRVSGLASGLGAAAADTVYAAVAAFGLTAMSFFFLGHQFWIRLIGGVFMLYLGCTILVSQPAAYNAKASGRQGLLAHYGSTFILTLANPITILSYTAIFAGLGTGTDARTLVSPAQLVIGTFVGSSLWWLLLTVGVGSVRGLMDQHKLKWVNRVAGAIIVVLAAIIIGSVVNL